MEISKMTTAEIEEALHVGVSNMQIERALLMELRVRTGTERLSQIHGVNIDSDRISSNVDFFWQMQEDILRDILDDYLRDLPISPSARRAVKDRATNYMLQNAIVVYQEGETVLEESGILAIAESFAQDYQWFDEADEQEETQQEQETQKEPERIPLETHEQAVSKAAQRREARGVRRRR